MQWGRNIKWIIAGAILGVLIPTVFWVSCILAPLMLATLWLLSRNKIHRCPGAIPAWERIACLLLLRPWCLVLGHEFAHITRALMASIFEDGIIGVECAWCGYVERNWLSLIEAQGADSQCNG